MNPLLTGTSTHTPILMPDCMQCELCNCCKMIAGFQSGKPHSDSGCRMCTWLERDSFSKHLTWLLQVHEIFFAKYDPKASWLSDLVPAFGADQFFFEDELDCIAEADTSSGLLFPYSPDMDYENMVLDSWIHIRGTKRFSLANQLWHKGHERSIHSKEKRWKLQFFVCVAKR